MHIYKHRHTWQTPATLTMEEAVIRQALHEQDSMKLLLAGTRGTMLALLTEGDAQHIMSATGARTPEELQGQRVYAHLDGSRITGVSLR